MTQVQRTSVLVIDASILTAGLVADYLRQTGALDVVGVAATTATAVELVREYHPIVVIIDRVPGRASDAELLEATRHADAALVVFSPTPPRDDPADLRTAGIEAVALKEIGRLDLLLDAVQRAAATRRHGAPGDGGPPPDHPSR